MLEDEKKWKKDPDAPRRFKSAYMFFSQAKHHTTREQFIQQQKDNADTSKVKTTDIVRLVAAAWKELKPDDKKEFDEMAKNDKARYDVEKSMYNGPWKIRAGGRQKKNPSAPKRPMSAFISYSNKVRPTAKKKHPKLDNVELARLLSKMWKDAPEHERRPHIEEEFKQRKKYKKLIALWRADDKMKQDSKRMEREDIAMQKAMSGSESIFHQNRHTNSQLTPSSIDGDTKTRSSTSYYVRGNQGSGKIPSSYRPLPPYYSYYNPDSYVGGGIDSHEHSRNDMNVPSPPRETVYGSTTPISGVNAYPAQGFMPPSRGATCTRHGQSQAFSSRIDGSFSLGSGHVTMRRNEDDSRYSETTEPEPVNTDLPLQQEHFKEPAPSANFSAPSSHYSRVQKCSVDPQNFDNSSSYSSPRFLRESEGASGVYPLAGSSDCDQNMINTSSHSQVDIRYSTGGNSSQISYSSAHRWPQYVPQISSPPIRDGLLPDQTMYQQDAGQHRSRNAY